MGKPTGGARSSIPRIGVVSLWLSGNPYERDVVTGVVDVVEARGASAVCFAVHGIKDDFDAFIGTESVDGLVVLSASLVQFVGKKALDAFCEKRRSLPIVALGMGLSGLPTIGVNDAGGVKMAISHLIEVHGRRRIGFIRGPEASGDIGDRFCGYREALVEHGLPFDPKWVTSSSGFGGAGDEVRALLEGPPERLEAIVAFNDATALAAISALTDRGIRVPQDISVVGFDETLEAAFAIPPLTTITQRLEEQGRRAASLVLDALEGRPIPNHVVLDTALVVRRSCGCFPRSVLEAGGTRLPSSRQPSDRSLEASREDIAAEMRCVLATDQAAAVDRILAAFSSDLATGSTHEFLVALDEELDRAARSLPDLLRWGDAISAMRRLTLPYLSGDATLLARAENAWHKARVLMSDTVQRAQAFLRLLDSQRADALADVSRSLITTRNLPDLVVVLSESLRRFEVKSCYLSLYDDRDSKERSTLVLGVDDTGRVSDLVSTQFRTSCLAPDGILPKHRNHTTVVMPLAFEDQQLGMILLEGHPNQATAYDRLRNQFGAAFKRMADERELAALHAALQEHLEELEQAHQALRENRERLLISESMASLGRLTAGMAHEMNTPLAAVRAALGELLDLISEFRTSIDGPDVTSQDLRDIAAEMETATKLADNAAHQVAGFVRSIKAETRELASKDLRHFDPLVVTKDALMLLAHGARAANCTVTLGAEPRPPLDLFGSPGRLAQIVTNLVTNAIQASAEKGGGPIVVHLQPSDGAVELRVSDRGIGIAPDDVRKIFEPMYTSKPFGVGTGLGLTIVHDIVTAHFNGTIDVETEPGLGTTFILRLRSAG